MRFLLMLNLTTETVAQKCSVEKVFLEILQNSREDTYARVSFLIKLQAWGPGTGVFLFSNVVKFLRAHMVAASVTKETKKR